MPFQSLPYQIDRCAAADTLRPAQGSILYCGVCAVAFSGSSMKPTPDKDDETLVNAEDANNNKSNSNNNIIGLGLPRFQKQ